MSGVKPSNLRERVRKILFEDTWQKYGSEYMSHPYDQDDDEEDTTIPPNLPITPDDLMANQLAVERPPIDDEEFVPDGVEELTRAVAALSQEVPVDQVGDFWNTVKGDLEVAIDKNNNPETIGDGESQEEKLAKKAELEAEKEGVGSTASVEESIRSAIQGMIKEQMSDWSNIKFGRQYKLDEPYEEDEDAEEAAGVKDTIKGKHLAPYYKKSGPSGVNVGTDRLALNHMRHLMEVPAEELEDSLDYLRFHFRENAPELPDSKGAERAFIGMILKTVVRRTMKSVDNLRDNLLPGVVNYWKSLNDKKIIELITKAVEEDASEKEDFAALVATLQDEEPEQYEVLQDLGLA
tara:strand:- start:1267 stop:2316 length:1050 start_codon:yes stop_codon:yes gene_type:complete